MGRIATSTAGCEGIGRPELALTSVECDRQHAHLALTCCLTRRAVTYPCCTSPDGARQEPTLTHIGGSRGGGQATRVRRRSFSFSRKRSFPVGEPALSFFSLAVSRAQSIYQRHAPVLLTMARGVWELRESFAPSASGRKAQNRFTDFYDFERVRPAICYDLMQQL